MVFFLLAALLPGLYWDKGPETAPALKSAGIERVYVPAAKAAAWSNTGIAVTPLDPAKLVKAPPPGVQYRMSVASATRVPWIDANGWRFLRDPSRTYFYEVPAGSAALALAEAYTYGVEAVVHPDASDLDLFGRMLRFLRENDRPRMPAMSNIGLIDDGSDEMGEVMNLLVRRNLLVRVVRAPDPKLDLNVRLGTKEYPREEAGNPSEFAMKVRQKLGDEKRLLRIYGSEVVIGRLTGEGGRARLYLVNYSRRGVIGLRVRVRGEYAKGSAAVFGAESVKLADYATAAGATEFTVPQMDVCAVVDLEGKRQ